MTRLTIGILTLNEERRIEACIRSCSFADQVVVVDSGSKDRTVEIAKGLGAEIFVYPDWQGFAEQRNRMLQHVRGDYILFIDADEEVPADLRAEVQAAVASGQDAVWKVYPDLSHAHDWEAAIEATSFVPDEVVAQLCEAMGLVGTPADCAARIRELTALGVQSLYLMPLLTFAPPEREITAFRETIFPALARAGLR